MAWLTMTVKFLNPFYQDRIACILPAAHHWPWQPKQRSFQLRACRPMGRPSRSLAAPPRHPIRQPFGPTRVLPPPRLEPRKTQSLVPCCWQHVAHEALPRQPMNLTQTSMHAIRQFQPVQCAKRAKIRHYGKKQGANYKHRTHAVCIRSDLANALYSKAPRSNTPAFTTSCKSHTYMHTRQFSACPRASTYQPFF